jgi:cell division transport system ATP-binding protein
VIQLMAVTKVFPRTVKPALDDVSFVVERGELAVLCGPGGSGKSTVLKLITGRTWATSGVVHVNGWNVTGLRGRRLAAFRRTIGYVPQRPLLLGDLTAYENVAFAMMAQGRSPGVARRLVPEILELVGLGGKEHRYPFELSVGERRRVAMARALVHRPSAVIIDEPSAELDPDTAIEIYRLLISVGRTGSAILLTATDPVLPAMAGVRVIPLESGQVVDGL